MTILSGRGILVPLLVLAAFGLGFWVIHPYQLQHQPTAKATPTHYSLLVATVALWIFVNTLGKPAARTSIDSRTGMPVTVTTRHAFLFLPPMAWAIVMSCLVGVSMVTMWASIISTPPTAAEQAASAGRNAFEKANLLITSSREGIAHGNSPDAEKLAAAFSEELKAARSMGIEKSSGKSIISLTKGQFPTYCLLTPARCVFMVHVPDLRHFSSDAKDFVAEAAWIIARGLVADAGSKSTLMVGIRGSIMYDRVVVARSPEVMERGLAHMGNDSMKELIAEFHAALSEKPQAPIAVAGVSTGNDSQPEAAPPAAVVPQSRSQPPQPAPAAAAPALSPAPVSAVPAPVAPPQSLFGLRAWTDTTGRPMKASFVRFTSESKEAAEFKREDGQSFTIPLQRFSAEDQAFILNHPELKK